MFRKSKLKTIVGQRQLNRRISKNIQAELVNCTNVIKKPINLISSDDESLKSSNAHKNRNNLDTDQWVENSLQFTNMSNNIDSTETIYPRQLSLSEKLRKWAVDEKVSHSAVTSLLHILQDYHPLPLDCRTLLKTPRQIKTKVLPNGEYIHFNLRITLENILLHSLAQFSNKIILLSFNVDGLPLFQSSNLQFWPILCLVKNIGIVDPFVVGAFCGNSKPEPVDLFLEDFIEELSELLENGITCNHEFFSVNVHSFICDAPARAYIKRVKSHGGYSSCDKCTEYGQFVNGRVILKNLNADKRTDNSFYLQSDENHHLGVSPLTKLNIGLVSLFPIDYMHAVCLGVMRKLLNTWIGGKLQVRLQARLVQTLSQNLLLLKGHTPFEINRKPRSLAELARWKATEFRTFLLYWGPALLKDIVDIAIYEHFLLFHCGILILSSSKHITHFGTEFSKQLLNTFISHCKEVYGLEYFVYNIHILTHLSDDAEKYGCLDQFSAFPFENFLGQLKQLVKSSNRPLHQLYNRLAEANNLFKPYLPSTIVPHFLYEHNYGPTLNIHGSYKQYKKVAFSDFILTTCSYSVADCFFLTKGNIVKMYNILCNDQNKYILIGKKFTTYDPLYSYPVNSKVFNICIVKDLAVCEEWAGEEIEAKCVVFPYSTNMWVSFPLIHTF